VKIATGKGNYLSKRWELSSGGQKKKDKKGKPTNDSEKNSIGCSARGGKKKRPRESRKTMLSRGQETYATKGGRTVKDGRRKKKTSSRLDKKKSKLKNENTGRASDLA